MSSYYGPWIWSPEHGSHYAYLYAADGRILDTLWEGPPASSRTTESTTVTQVATPVESIPRNIPPTSVSSYQYPDPNSPQRHYVATSQPPTGYSFSRVNYADRPSSASYNLPPVHGSASSRASHNIATERDYNSAGVGSHGHQRYQTGFGSGQQGQANHTVSGSNQNTSLYSPSGTHSIVSAHASMTTASGSPYPYQHPQIQNGFPFIPSSSRQPQQASSNMATGQPSQYPGPRRPVTSLPYDVQSTIRSLDRRYIQTDPNAETNQETLDPRYRRVAKHHHATFFVLGRVFKMLWTEPAGQANPGKTRNSTHFSTVLYGQTAFSEIRRFVVVRNKGDFSQCIPIQTYKGQGATKQGLIVDDHGVIHTTASAPDLLPGEKLTKYSVQVQPYKDERLEPESRVNYGKAYAVEHNVKVLEVGMVLEGHRYLIQQYFDSAMRSQ